MIYCVVLLAMVGNAFSNEPKPPPKELAVDLGRGVKLEMVLIPAGEFLMGSPDADKNASNVEKPQHRVRITRPFCLGKYVVTQQQWESVMGSKPSRFQGPKNPVEQVSWEDCRGFVEKVSAKVGGGKFSLPTEAQWEYACRAGSTTRYCFGDEESGLGEYAWYDKNSDRKTHPVGEKKPNAWGLYDMHGNVLEWCQDWYGQDYYAKSPTDDPTGPVTGSRLFRQIKPTTSGKIELTGPATGSFRVFRGGGWPFPARGCRSASRGIGVPGHRSNDQGFRVARVAE